jgi:hypothetical protein
VGFVAIGARKDMVPIAILISIVRGFEFSAFRPCYMNMTGRVSLAVLVTI